MIQLVGQTRPLIDYEVVKADADSRDWIRVEGDHRVPKCYGHQQAGKAFEMETRVPARGRGQRTFNSEPGDQDYGKSSEQMRSERFEHRRMARHQRRQE